MSTTESKSETTLEETIARVLKTMTEYPCQSNEYVNLTDTLVKLHALKENDHKIKHSRRVDSNTIAMVIGNLAGIAAILSHERAHVIASKALSFVMKTR